MSEYDYERPFNLMQWVADHAHELTPPVANKQVYADSRMIVMIVGGAMSAPTITMTRGKSSS